MYGLVLESMGDSLRRKLGDKTWEEIRTKAKIPVSTFAAKKTYSETMVPRLIKAACDITEKSSDEILGICGLGFVTYISRHGYDRLMRVLGRHLRDFLNGLDNVHEFLRFSFPKLKPPSFFIERETKDSIVLHYRSKRKGLIPYVTGQIQQVAKQFYNTVVQVEVLMADEAVDNTHVVLKLMFDNSVCMDEMQKGKVGGGNLPITYDILFEIFPYHIVFTPQMVITDIGSGLAVVMPFLIGQTIDEMFTLTRPMIEFSMENIRSHSNNFFELLSVDNVRRMTTTMTAGPAGPAAAANDKNEEKNVGRKLKIKGQMIFMEEWDSILFLATPIMETLKRLFQTGMYINDLSMHDCSRDLVLIGTQQQAEFKLAMDLEKEKSAKLNENMQALDKEMKRTDQLLYQMIPKQVAERLRKGEPAMNTCQLIEKVTILFTDVVGFTSICSKLNPMGVVDMLNDMYVRFDNLTAKHRVYKVETIGDAYMVVSGAPVITTFHALYISDMAFDMVEAMRDMEDPSQGPGSNMRIRVGIHTGPVVAGIVGIKMPRYCLIGESVNTANKMESSGAAMRIHISETTRAELVHYPNYEVEIAEPVDLQGKGLIKTFWLVNKIDDPSARGPKAGMSDAVNDTS